VKASPVHLFRQYLRALQNAGGGGMAIAGGRIVILRCGTILMGCDLTLS
jgi:hypothetical protein